MCVTSVLLVWRVCDFFEMMTCTEKWYGVVIGVVIAICRDVDVAFDVVLWWNLVLSKKLASRVRRGVVLNFRMISEIIMTSSIVRVRDGCHVW